MPFLHPRKCFRNAARYQEVECTEDFILQQHRYSIRKHAYMARIITKNGRPHLKVAKSYNVTSALEREWKYIKEELPNRMPNDVRSWSVGSQDRLMWLLNHLMTVKFQIGDDPNDDDEEEDDEDEDDDFATEEEYAYSNNHKNTDAHFPQYLSMDGKSASDSNITTSRASQPGLSALDSPRSLAGNRNRLIRSLPHMLPRHSGNDQVRPVSDSGLLSPLPQPPGQQFGETATSFSDGESPATHHSNSKLHDGLGMEEEKCDSGTTPQGASKQLGRKNMSSFFERSLSSLTASDDTMPLPSYLLSSDFRGNPNNKKNAVTMEAMKREHERKSMAIGVVAATLLFLLMRVVSFDAFVILLIAINICVCYFVKHRHALVRRFAKSSIKRRVRFTKKWMNYRLGRQPTRGSSSADDGGSFFEEGANYTSSMGPSLSVSKRNSNSIRRSLMRRSSFDGRMASPSPPSAGSVDSNQLLAGSPNFEYEDMDIANIANSTIRKRQLASKQSSTTTKFLNTAKQFISGNS